MIKSKGARVLITLEHRTLEGAYRYYTSKNVRKQSFRFELKKYSPLTRKHEIFKEVK